jgi:hypothetical protein
MKRVSWLTIVLALGCIAFAQDKGSMNAKPKEAPVDLHSQTLTQEDLSVSINRLEVAIRKVLNLEAIKRVDSDIKKPATREQVISEFHRLFSLAKDSFKFTPKKLKFDEKSITIKPKAPERAKIETLIAWQFVAKVGPLATSPKPGLNLYQYGDALGFFITRLADLTHTPSSKWSPYLQGDATSAQGSDKSKQPDKSK